jgi:hypothetical protein
MSDEYFAAIEPETFPAFRRLASDGFPGMLVEILAVTDSLITLRWCGDQHPRREDWPEDIRIRRESDGILLAFDTAARDQRERFLNFLGSKLEQLTGEPVSFEAL